MNWRPIIFSTGWRGQHCEPLWLHQVPIGSISIRAFLQQARPGAASAADVIVMLQRFQELAKALPIRRNTGQLAQAQAAFGQPIELWILVS